ncbi:MAG TPA: FAD:protein FMN transferase [Steroidobacteraceae bacterium]|nr:FAD:protein FMN transferase [Steroidobacteraceae bacterium]
MHAQAQVESTIERELRLEARGREMCAVCFLAMGSPCELLLPAMSGTGALALAQIAAREAWRIEQKFSRYRDDSVIAWIHAHRGELLELDEESASLIDFAAHCHELSEGLFDITSGVLGQAWRFDGAEHVPDPQAIERLLASIGFEKIQWQRPRLMLPEGMELDLGGIGKEYAVDRVHELLALRTSMPFLVNFGGDLRANRPPQWGPWQVGIERPDSDREATMVLGLERGALATSGDSRRFVRYEGRRYGHILDPRTGWPVPQAPRSVSVAASSCTEAGLLSTLAMLKGAAAEQFLAEQQVPHWVLR